MTPKELFKEIMEDDDDDDVLYPRRGCPIFRGLGIINQYIDDGYLIVAAEHDIVYSVEVEELLEAGIKEVDIKELRKLGWHVSEFDTLAHYA